MNELNDVDFNSAMSAFESKHFGQACQLLSPFAHQGNADAQHRSEERRVGKEVATMCYSRRSPCHLEKTTYILFL